ncbi:CRISPR-associated protein Cas5 [Candidatus Nitrosotenuis uzonensis]|uniref:CRISPR-associated protein Cas5 n=1 Tax=Candidatus Nitrosotenuis uzonensis TaxID=1407055 RepID=A0A812EYL0_9ARCH|nr:CRISPR-associated protein Cas5 [Candidatus Nitrosotenuis uzonensis]CAE6493558.1 CRISPR-associated protein Cas5 [Candidatus Nitrosotenuis uzonensis]
MLKIISFAVSGAFAAFRDPSVTSNQTVYFIPSKSAVIGLLGAIVGVQRSNNLNDAYGEQYLDFFKKTRIGLQLETQNPKKITMFTNHRSLKEAKTKPFKTELFENPKYRIFVKTEEPYYSRLADSLQSNNFTYSPYFGHAYCPATITEFTTHNSQDVDPEGEITKCVVLDESETYDLKFKLTLKKAEDNSSLMIERHLHHYFDEGKFERKVLKHWIPTNNTKFKIDEHSGSNLSEFVNIDGHVVCIY